MSNIDPTITNTDVIPVVESSVFQYDPAARFASGVLAIADQPLPGLEKEYAAYFDLRREVYVNQTGQLDASEIQDDGTDRDIDDSRSVAFGIIENRLHDRRIVAATRLIIKGFAEDDKTERPLPVEEFCPDIFAETPAPRGSLEVSRLIARHEKAAIQGALKGRMYAHALAYITQYNLGPTYAVVEPWLERDLKSSMPMRRIGEPRYVEHYLDYNLPIEVDTTNFAKLMDKKQPGLLDQLRQNEEGMNFFGKAVEPVARQDDRRKIMASIPKALDRRNTDRRKVSIPQYA